MEVQKKASSGFIEIIFFKVFPRQNGENLVQFRLAEYARDRIIQVEKEEFYIARVGVIKEFHQGPDSGRIEKNKVLAIYCDHFRPFGREGVPRFFNLTDVLEKKFAFDSYNLDFSEIIDFNADHGHLLY